MNTLVRCDRERNEVLYGAFSRPSTLRTLAVAVTGCCSVENKFSDEFHLGACFLAPRFCVCCHRYLSSDCRLVPNLEFIKFLLTLWHS